MHTLFYMETININSITKEAKQLIADGYIFACIEMLNEVFEKGETLFRHKEIMESLQNDLQLYENKYNLLEREKSKGLLSEERVNVQKSKLTNSILSYIDLLQHECEKHKKPRGTKHAETNEEEELMFDIEITIDKDFNTFSDSDSSKLVENKD
jgi:predicted ATPase